jgi:hypothetical protein
MKLSDIDLGRPWRGVVRVSLSDVDAMLDRNTDNRQVVKGNVTRYLELIRNGEWRTDLFIQFDNRRILQDGQHRLIAIKTAMEEGFIQFIDIGIECGCDPARRHYIDAHLTRGIHERVEFQDAGGVTAQRHVGMIVNTMFRLGGQASKRPSPQQATNLYETHRDGILPVVNSWIAGTSGRYITAPIAVAITEYICKHREQGLAFLREFVSENTSDVNASMLQKRVLSSRLATCGHGTVTTRYRTAVAACRNHRDGVTPKMLKEASWDSERTRTTRQLVAA